MQQRMCVHSPPPPPHRHKSEPMHMLC
jgi:hypothetical protein